MTDNQICSLISEEIEGVEKENIELNPDFAPLQRDIIDLIDYYWMDRYRDGNTDVLGLRKPFYNIIENPTMVASKMIDLDTKDINILAGDGASYYPAWFYEKDLKLWMKEKSLGKFLNTLVYNYPKYGHILIKKIRDNVQWVPLQNIYNQGFAKSILVSDFVIEKHEYTAYQLRQQGWDKKRVEKIIDANESEDKIKVFERHGDIEKDKNNYIIVAYSGDDGLILHKDNIDRDKLYRELKWDDIPGRALGRGQVEKLFEAQIHTNKIAHYKDRGLHWTSKHIYQTRDSRIGQNMLTGVDDGEIIITNDEITPIAVEERNLPAYRDEETRWQDLVDKRTFSFDVVRGERTPSGTPLGSAMLQTQMAGGFFEIKREDLGMFLKDMFFDWVIPSFKSERGKEHEIMLKEFSDDETDKFRKLLVDGRFKKANGKLISRGIFKSREELQALKEMIEMAMSKQRGLKIPKGLYDNIKYKIDVVITGEQIDVASRLTTLQTVLQILGSNPTILKDPNARKVFLKTIDLAGFDPSDFETEEGGITEAVAQLQAQRGGSIARTAQPSSQPIRTQQPVNV